MNATISSPTVGIAGQAASTRVLSIDIFRGITMAVMIFVNDLASVHGLSKWTYHMPAKVDAMTYVDMVFPAFLFIVGMALPIAVKQRLKRNASLASLWLHVVLRVIALLVLGLILANAEHGDRARMHIASELWALLGLVGAILLWNVYSGLSSRMVLLPGVVEILERLDARDDVALALLTGNWQPGAEAKLARFDLNRFFPFGAFGCDGADRSTLPPVAWERAEERLGRRFLPEETLIVGDSIHDVSCAHAHGIPCLAVCTGRTPAARLHAAGADWVAADLDQAGLHLPWLA